MAKKAKEVHIKVGEFTAEQLVRQNKNGIDFYFFEFNFFAPSITFSLRPFL